MSAPQTNSTHHQELISEEMRELISYRPYWIIRKGNIFFFFVVCLLLSLTWIIRYPDIIKSSIKLTSSDKATFLQGMTPSVNRLKGRMMISSAGSGKIKTGQKVLVSFENFPSTKSGYVIGVVDTIIYLPDLKDSLFVIVNFPKGLQTDYGKNVSYRNDLSGDAEIITEDRKLFDRIADHIKEMIRTF